jgi:hypothetical protein
VDEVRHRQELHLAVREFDQPAAGRAQFEVVRLSPFPLPRVELRDLPRRFAAAGDDLAVVELR